MTTPDRTARVVQLRRSPQGSVRADDLELADVMVPALEDGQVLVRNRWMSIDPYMRLTLSSQAGYLVAVQPGETLNAAAIGIVEESRDATMPAGCTVLSQMGWRTRFVARASDLTQVDGGIPGPWHLGILGLTGVTAYLGIETVLQPQAGETVFISGAAGAVGAMACQLAKRRGARVLGSAGSTAKVDWLLDEVGVDAATNYRDESIASFLQREAPDGVECYFDNVGGATLGTLLRHMKAYGRVGLCGAMSQYESGDYRSGPDDFFSAIEKSLSLRGFNTFLLSAAQSADIAERMRALAEDGSLKPLATIIDGIEAAPEAFARLFGQGFHGKAIIKLDG